MAACAKEPQSALPDLSSFTTVNSDGSEELVVFYESKLTPNNSSLTKDDSDVVKYVVLQGEGDNPGYAFEIGNPCYLKDLSSGLQEIVVKPGAYICSNSEYQVNRLIIDFYGGKGTNFNVYNNKEGKGNPLPYHESGVLPQDPNDGGMVYEYAIDGKEWIIKNETEFNKPAFYSITVIFSK